MANSRWRIANGRWLYRLARRCLLPTRRYNGLTRDDLPLQPPSFRLEPSAIRLPGDLRQRSHLPGLAPGDPRSLATACRLLLRFDVFMYVAIIAADGDLSNGHPAGMSRRHHLLQEAGRKLSQQLVHQPRHIRLTGISVVQVDAGALAVKNGRCRRRRHGGVTGREPAPGSSAASSLPSRGLCRRDSRQLWP